MTDVELRSDGGVASIAPHFYVRPTAGQAGYVPDPAATDRVQPCARKGCRCAPQHPVHLRPPGDDPVQGLLATGT